MSKRWSRPRGAVDDTIVMEVTGLDPSTADHLEARVRLPGVVEVPVVLPAFVSDPAARAVTVQLGGAVGWLPAAELGEWEMRLWARFNPDSWIPIPDGAPAIIEVTT